MTQPKDSDWVLKAGIRYGRTATNRNVHKSFPDQTATLVTLPTGLANAFGFQDPASCYSIVARFGPIISCPFAAHHPEFIDVKASTSEKHEILEFTLGKDIGIGVFGHDGKGTLGAGLRIAQFDTNSRSRLNSDPNFKFPSILELQSTSGERDAIKYGHIYDATTEEQRNFHGIGPEITWDSNQAIWGNEHDGKVTVDWGVNAAVLFGRQKAHIQQSLFGEKIYRTGNGVNVSYSTTLPRVSRSRTVTVPNLGGYVGASMRYQNAKISFGYRADEFFGAMDGGQDTAKNYNRGFYGPYLNLSLGLGG